MVTKCEFCNEPCYTLVHMYGKVFCSTECKESETKFYCLDAFHWLWKAYNRNKAQLDEGINRTVRILHLLQAINRRWKIGRTVTGGYRS